MILEFRRKIHRAKWADQCKIMIKRIIIKILLRLLVGEYYKPLSSNEVNSLLNRLANEEGFSRLPDFLEQCSTQYKNQYLFSGNEMFKGSVLAFTSLRERIIEKKVSTKIKRAEKILTSPHKSGKIKTTY